MQTTSSRGFHLKLENKYRESSLRLNS